MRPVNLITRPCLPKHVDELSDAHYISFIRINIGKEPISNYKADRDRRFKAVGRKCDSMCQFTENR